MVTKKKNVNCYRLMLCFLFLVSKLFQIIFFCLKKNLLQISFAGTVTGERRKIICHMSCLNHVMSSVSLYDTCTKKNWDFFMCLSFSHCPFTHQTNNVSPLPTNHSGDRNDFFFFIEHKIWVIFIILRSNFKHCIWNCM